MTAIHPPRVAEAILESFGADAEFRDAILGDLTQEHAQRAERFGPRAARLWYYRQAVFASQALLRNWLAGAKFVDARRLLNVAGLAYVTTMMINMLVFFGGSAVVTSILPKSAWNVAANIGFVMMVIAAPICAGYLAATFEESKPMTAAISLAFIWACFQGLGAIYVYFAPDLRLDMPMLMRIAAIPFLMAACILGAVLRVRRVSALRVAEASSILS